MIEKIETTLMCQFNFKYIKYFRLRCNAIVMQYILNLLECVSYIKMLQGLSNKYIVEKQ